MNRLKYSLLQKQIAFCSIAVLTVLLIPMVIIGFYDHPSYDDFGYAALTVKAYREHSSIIALLWCSEFFKIQHNNPDLHNSCAVYAAFWICSRGILLVQRKYILYFFLFFIKKDKKCVTALIAAPLLSVIIAEGVFPPHLSAEKQKKRRYRRKNKFLGLSTDWAGRRDSAGLLFV